MKKQILSIAIVLFGFASAQAQCTISPTCTPDANTGYCTVPAEDTALPNGEVGTPYNFVVQISLGTTAGGGAATINDAEITGVTLPTGLTYTTNPANGVINGGSSGCIEITGTPTTDVVDFSVDVEVLASTSFGPVPYSFSYTLTIDASTASINEVNIAELTLFPNPVEDKLTVTVKEPTVIKVTNVLGTVVLDEKINSSKTLNVSGLKNGIYFVTNTTTGRSTKFVKK